MSSAVITRGYKVSVTLIVTGGYVSTVPGNPRKVKHNVLKDLPTTKPPAEVLEVDFDFTAWLQPNDTIRTSTVYVGAGMTVGEKSHVSGGRVVRQLLSGGKNAANYKVVCRVATVKGWSKDADIIIRVRG